MNPRRMNLACVLAAAWLIGAQPAASTGAAVAATVEQPRSFGHVLGDVLVQRVLLARDGHSVEATALPAADRVNLYLDRRAARIEQDERDRRWLVIEYQVVNAPRALTAVSVPALSVATAAGPLQVAAWPISVGPLTPAATFDQGALQPLRPDRPVTPQATDVLERQLKGTLAALAGLLLAWGAWWAWRNARESHRLPFARAWRQLRRTDPASAEAWRVLHHALNAGQDIRKKFALVVAAFGAQLLGRQPVRVLLVHGQEHNAGLVHPALHALRNLQAVEARHGDVQQKEVGHKHGCHRQRLQAVMGFAHHLGAFERAD